MDSLLQDLRYTFRALRRTPGFALVAVLTVALGIAATTSVFSVISALLLRPLPVAEPDRLVTLDEERQGAVRKNMGYSSFTFARREGIQEAARDVFTGVAGYTYGEGSIRVDGPAEVVNRIFATANFFDVLGLRPAAGGFFSPAADRERLPEVVISHDLWTRRFATHPSVVGRTLRLDGRAYTVVGVAPEGFTGIIAGLPVDVWQPVDPGNGTPGSGDELVLFGRLRPGVSAAQARAAMEVVSRQVPPEGADVQVVGVRVLPLTAVPFNQRASLVGFLAMLLATALLVLTISSTNVGGMLLARAAARRREVAVRLAIGAGRRRLVQQLLTESVLLFSLGTAGGVLLTAVMMRAASAYQPPVPVRVAFQFGVDGRVLAFACALALATGLLFGLAPALQATRGDVGPALKDGDRAGSGHRTRLRSGFVVAQLALSLLLLITAGLFVRTLQSALATDVGFDPSGVVVGIVDVGPHDYDEARGRALQAQLLERARSIAGVESAALALWAPMNGNTWSERIRPAGGDLDAEAIHVGVGIVGPGYFETLRIPLRAGRDFTTADGPGAPLVAVVNESFAERLWPGRSPLGERFRWDDDEVEVIGVAADGKYEQYRDPARPFLYVPMEQRFSPSATVLLRTRAEPAAALAALRNEVAALDADLALRNPATLETQIGFHIFPQRMAAWSIGVFGLAGLLLAAIGLYGVLAFQVAARTRELGIRIALGAGAARVVRLVLASSLRLVALGTVFGLAAAFAVTRLLESMLFGVSPTDAATFVAVPTLLLALSLVASYLPVRHATRVDPVVALRAE